MDLLRMIEVLSSILGVLSFFKNDSRILFHWFLKSLFVFFSGQNNLFKKNRSTKENETKFIFQAKYLILVK
jgi:hypothetical protein